MGLFGGFKAKFSSNHEKKEKKEKPQGVVCLRYHVHSEFDAPRPPVPVRTNIRKNEVVKNNLKGKKRSSLVKSAIFPDNKSPTLSAAQKSTSLVNLSSKTSSPKHIRENGYAGSSDSVTTSTTIETPSNSRAISDTKLKRSIEEHNGTVTQNVAIVTNKHRYSGNDNKKTEEHEKAVLKTFSTHSDSKTDHLTNGVTNAQSREWESTQKLTDNDQSTLIFMTQHGSDNYEKMENGNEDFERHFTKTIGSFKNPINNFADESDEKDGDNFNFKFVQHKTTFDDEDDFKVNVVKHDLNRSYSHSEDERSYHEEEQLHFTTTGYSSQAASIFFGEDVEPEIARPRRIQLKNEDDEDDRRSSGADC